MSEERDDDLRSLAEHVHTPLSDARIERQWSAIESAGLPAALPARSRLGLIAAISFAVAAGATAVVLLASQPPKVVEGAWLESAQAEVAVRLEDGSRVELSPQSQLRLVENRQQRVALELRSGHARFEVKHDRTRPFSIAVGPAEVRVIGTRFELLRGRQAGASSLRVVVTEGVVEVRRRDRAGEPPQRIHAGESWSVRLPDAGAPAQAAREATAAAPGVDEAEAAPRADEPEVTSAEGDQEDVKRAPSRPHSRAAKPPEEDAGELFSRASLARRAGRMRDAADGYAALLEHFPDDDRAGLSAFELGRIRMDALGDAQGAIAALERSLHSGGGSSASFHEDALARIVIASDALGRRDACRDARARYLARYPNGVHAQVLSARCR